MSRVAALAVILMSFAIAFAQESACPALQANALSNIAERCAKQEAGTLCLGGATVTPVFRGSAQSAALDAPGATIAIADIDWLSISSEDETWGAARALFPAYPADSLDSSDAALLAFGNVALFLPAPVALPATLVAVKVTAAQGANLRASPSTDAPIVDRLAVSRDLKASGLLRGGGWLLIHAAPDRSGWISQTVVSKPDEDLPALAPDAEAARLWLPWQRFDFHSGIDDAPCAGAPESGILLQSSKTVAPRQFVINGARVSISGAAWLQAQASQGMLIHLLDGRARVSTAAGAVDLSNGQFVQVTLARADDDELIAGESTAPESYDYHDLSDLPLYALPYAARVSLDRALVVAPAPASGESPLESLDSGAPCTFSALTAGANIRSRPDPEAPVIAVMAHRESAEPLARAIGADSLPWWKLADRIWVRVDATVSGGNCNDLPLLRAGN